MKYEDFISHFEIKRHSSNKSCMAICPSHSDKKASLSITNKGDRILINCFAGCTSMDILNAVGLTSKDLFNNRGNKQKAERNVEKKYCYFDVNNNLVYKAVRYTNKDFEPERLCNGKWIHNLINVERIPYNLPNVVKSEVIYWVEGEKDADNLNKIGLTATTSIRGSNRFS